MSSFIKNMRKEEKAGLIGTIGFHLLLLLFFLLFGLKSMDPPPDSGILLNFGTSDVGSGEVQPEKSSAEEVVPDTPDEIDASPTDPTPVQEEVMTQDVEETVEVEEKKEEEKVEEKKPEISDELKQTLSNAFNKNKNQANEGDDDKAGDKGKTDGELEGKAYDGQNGGNGNGISFSLSGRGQVSIPKPDYNTQEEGKVVVSIIVNRKGEVVKATAGARGTTTTSSTLLEKAEQAAYKARFTKSPSAPEQQRGTITYVFVLE